MAQGSERSLEMLAAALEKERRGHEFYKEALEKCSNELGKEIFRILMAEEGVHIQRVRDIYGALESGKAWTSEWQKHRVVNEDLETVCRERAARLGPMVKPDSGDLEALDIGVGMEQAAINFYLDQEPKAVDALEKQFVTQMIAEERSHLRALEDLKLFFTNPESWHTEMERHGLDGA